MATIDEVATSLSFRTTALLLAWRRTGQIVFSTAGVSGSLFGGSATAALERRGMIAVDRSHWRDHDGRLTDFGTSVVDRLWQIEKDRKFAP